MRPVMPRSSEAACIFISVNDPRVREREIREVITLHTPVYHTRLLSITTNVQELIAPVAQRKGTSGVDGGGCVTEAGLGQ